MQGGQPAVVPFPVGGVSLRRGFSAQPENTTPSALNVWPTQWKTGRERGGTRPGLTGTGGSVSGDPYNWCEATWATSAPVTKRGIAVTAAGGTYVTENGSTWNERIATAPGSTFSSCAVYLQTLYQASIGHSPIYSYNLSSASGSNLTATQAEGTAPIYCGLVQAWGDRLVVAGDRSSPHVMYMCRIGDPTDWDYSAVDQAGAWANAGGGQGQIGEPITSIIPHNRECLFVGCTDSLYVIRGNPRAGGQIYVLSSQMGPLSQSAWCKTGSEHTIFLSRDGLYSVPPGCGEPPKSISREVLPDELVAIDMAGGDSVALGYDQRWRGVHIYARINSTDHAWFYDLQSGGFWPMSFGSSIRLAPNFKGLSSQDKSAMLAINSSGSVYQFNRNSSETIASHLYYGPIAVGSPYNEGILTSITAALSEDSGSVSWSLYGGDSAQEAFNSASPLFSGVKWDRQGFNLEQHPRIRCAAAYLKASGASNAKWSIEEIAVNTSVRASKRVG